MTKIAQGPGGLNTYPSGQDDQSYRHNPSDPHRNITDKKLPRHEDLVAKSRASQATGAKGIGLNDQAFTDSMADHGHGTEIRGSVFTPKSNDADNHTSPLNRPKNTGESKQRPQGFPDVKMVTPKPTDVQ